LYDFLLIRGVSKENVLKDLKRAIWPIAGLLLLGIILLSTTGFPMDYKVYTFTLKERILTEPRIVIFYLSLLLYPLPQRLMFDHDYVLSTSLFTPWTTGVAICFIIGLIAWAFFMARKRPLISFCILFFFINHVIESSIIPIEIIYEYRNYVPSISFFMLAALFMVRVLKFFQSEKVIFFMAAGCITFLLIAQADTVYRRNNLFFSENILWMDNIKKAPNLSRPHTNLGFLYQKEDNFKDALSEAKKAIEADKYPNYLSKATMYTNLGGSLLVMDNNNQEEALKNFLQAIILQPKFSNARFGAADVMIKKGDLASATEHILVAISLEPDQSFYHSKYSLILFHQGKYKESLKEAFRAWNLNYYNAEAKMIIAEIMKKRKLYKRAILFWNHYLIYVLNDRRAHLALIELYALTNQPDLAKAELNFLLVLEKGDLRSLLAQKNTYDHVYDINGNVLKPIIKKIIAEISQSAR
jgi:tetratricopeptide (TPR) repeat protein